MFIDYFRIYILRLVRFVSIFRSTFYSNFIKIDETGFKQIQFLNASYGRSYNLMFYYSDHIVRASLGAKHYFGQLHINQYSTESNRRFLKNNCRLWRFHLSSRQEVEGAYLSSVPFAIQLTGTWSVAILSRPRQSNREVIRQPAVMGSAVFSFQFQYLFQNYSMPDYFIWTWRSWFSEGPISKSDASLYYLHETSLKKGQLSTPALLLISFSDE